MATAKPESNPDPITDPVFTKYCMAGDIANRVLLFVIEKCVPEKPVLELSIEGDAMILEETGKIFRKEKSVKKGIAFPTSLSINNCACNYNPTPDTDKVNSSVEFPYQTWGNYILIVISTIQLQ